MEPHPPIIEYEFAITSHHIDADVSEYEASVMNDATSFYESQLLCGPSLTVIEYLNARINRSDQEIDLLIQYLENLENERDYYNNAIENHENHHDDINEREGQIPLNEYEIEEDDISYILSLANDAVLERDQFLYENHHDVDQIEREEQILLNDDERGPRELEPILYENLEQFNPDDRFRREEQIPLNEYEIEEDDISYILSLANNDAVLGREQFLYENHDDVDQIEGEEQIPLNDDISNLLFLANDAVTVGEEGLYDTFVNREQSRQDDEQYYPSEAFFTVEESDERIPLSDIEGQMSESGDLWIDNLWEDEPEHDINRIFLDVESQVEMCSQDDIMLTKRMPCIERIVLPYLDIGNSMRNFTGITRCSFKHFNNNAMSPKEIT